MADPRQQPDASPEPPRPPVPAVRRLSLYLRQLEGLADQARPTVSSRQLADGLGVTDAQVRKDLAYFGQFGRRGVGYRVAPLIAELRRILGTDKPQNVVVIGAGDLGRALMRYKGFFKKGFHLVAAFDVDPDKIGLRVDGVHVHHMDELEEILHSRQVRLAVLTVPAEAAQPVADRLAGAGVQGILNFAPTAVRVAPEVSLSLVDLAAHLEQLSFLAAGRQPRPSGSGPDGQLGRGVGPAD
jgi:redox-sensing transcriptional repressor